MGCLKNLVITSVGDQGTGKGNENLKRWVEANGGTWRPRVSKDITHVVCSKEAWKKNAEPVQQAKKLDAFIVSYDWLEDSLMKTRRLKETKYTWEVLRKQRRTQKEMKRLAPKSDALKFKQGCDLAQEDLGSGMSTSRKPGFFQSSLEDMKRRREERAAARSAARTKDTPNNAQDVLRDSSSEGYPRCTTPGGASRSATSEAASGASTPARPKSSGQEKQSPQPTLHPQSGMNPSKSLPTPTSTPAPSLFPPCLKYSVPTPSHQPDGPACTAAATPPSSKSPAPAPPAAKSPPVTKLTDLYHVFCDCTGFHYDIILLRQNPYLNNFAKYTLRLYESHTKPHVYATAVRYTPPASSQNTPGRLKPGENEFAAILGKAPRNDKHQEEKKPTGQHAEAARLTALITPAAPSSVRPFNKIITAPNSPFLPAMHAFRHVFRDLTLLTWEERLSSATTPLSDPSSLQRMRAQAFQIEPFIWRTPPPGMPVGRLPEGCEGVDFCASDTIYVRNQYELPALDEPLGEEGMLGSALVREAVAAKRREEEEQERKRMEEKRKRSLAMAKKAAGAGARVARAKTGKDSGKDTSSTRDGRAVFTQFPARNSWQNSFYLTGGHE